MYPALSTSLITTVLVLLWLGGVFGRSGKMPTNCLEATRLVGRNAKSGIYQIVVPHKDWSTRPFYVYCLCEPNCDNPWLLLIRRSGKPVSFHTNWQAYKEGFGNIEGDFFIGLDKIRILTAYLPNEMQIVLHDFNDTVKYANYDGFAIKGEKQEYEMYILGNYSGDAGDSLTADHAGRKFSTYDNDNDDSSKRNCASEYKSGWWFDACVEGNINGEYVNGAHKLRSGSGIMWNGFHGFQYSMKYAHMAIRPKIIGMKKKDN